MKDPLKVLKARTAKPRATHTYRAEGASLRFTEDLLAQMKASGVTRSALAGMIGTSPAYITKILRGETNFTLDTMVKIAHGLDCEVSVQLSPRSAGVSPAFSQGGARLLSPLHQSPSTTMATNPPTGDNSRRGQVTGRSQTHNPVTDRWTKRDTGTGRFMDQKADPKPFKGIRKER